MRLQRWVAAVLSVGWVSVAVEAAEAVAHPLEGSADGWMLVGQCNEEETWEVWSTAYNRRAVSEILIESYPQKGRQPLRLQSKPCSYAVRQFNMRDQLTIAKCQKSVKGGGETSQTVLYYPNKQMLRNNWLSTSDKILTQALSLADPKHTPAGLLAGLAKSYVSDTYGTDSWIAKNPLHGLYISHGREEKDYCRWDGRKGNTRGMRIFVKLNSVQQFCANPPSPKCTGDEIALPVSGEALKRFHFDDSKESRNELESALKRGPLAKLELHRSKCNTVTNVGDDDDEQFEVFATDTHGNTVALKRSVSIQSGTVQFRSLPLSNIRRLSFCSKSSRIWHGFVDYGVMNSEMKQWVDYKEPLNELPSPKDLKNKQNEKCKGRPISYNDKLIDKQYPRTKQDIRDCMEFTIDDKAKSLIYVRTLPKEEDNAESALAALVSAALDSESSSSEEDNAEGVPSGLLWTELDQHSLLNGMVSVCMAALILVISLWKTRKRNVLDKRKRKKLDTPRIVYGSV